MKYEDWVEKVNRNSKKADDEWGRYYLYLAFDKDKLVKSMTRESQKSVENNCSSSLHLIILPQAGQ